MKRMCCERRERRWILSEKQVKEMMEEETGKKLKNRKTE
jgi:hypothetical protein